MSRASLVVLALLFTAGSSVVLAQADAGRRRADSASPERRTDGQPPLDGQVTGTARVRGRLFAADTSLPVRFADVRVTSRTPRASVRTTTDAAGVFEVSGLQAGAYTIVATKAGFVSLQFGQRRPFEPGTPVELAAGETRELEFALPRGSVITGRITDDTGDPVPHAVVSASRYVYGAGGRRRLEATDADDTTDDRGQYRIFGLMPGEYVVSASEPASARGRSRSEPSSAEGYARTYYPGVPGSAEAATVVVGLAQEASASFGLVAARLSTVSGVVTDALGRPAAGATVLLGAGDGDDQSVVSAQTRHDGTFVLTGVSPGNLELTVRRSADAAGAAEVARLAVPVPAGTDVTGLAVGTGRGATIEGTLMFRAAASADRRGLSIVARPLDGLNVTSVGGGSPAPVDVNGRFRLEGVFGTVALELSGPGAAGWTMESVSVDGRDATDREVVAVPGRTVPARIVVSDRVTDVAGTVTDARGTPRSEFVAVFLPASVSDGVMPTRYVRTARASGPGQFHVRGLPSGNYVVVAVESLEDGREWDPSFQSWAREHGTAVRLDAGQQTTVTLAF